MKRIFFAAALLAAGCSPLTRSVLTLTVTADMPISMIDHLHVQFTDTARNRIAAPFDVGGTATIPPAINLPYVFGGDVSGNVHVRVQAMDSGSISLGSGDADFTIAPGKTVSQTVRLVPPGVPPGVTPSLSFSTQPSSTSPEKPFSIAVSIVDQNGSVITGATSNVSVSLNAGTSGAILSGMPTVQASAGVATFTGLTIDRPATGLTFTATASQIPNATSSAFDVAMPPYVALNTGLGFRSIKDIAVNPASSMTVYATGDGGAFKSTDGGNTWVAINSGLTSFDVLPAAYALALDPQAPNTLFLASAANLYKTTNGGQTWIGTGNQTPMDLGGQYYAIAINPKTEGIVYWAMGTAKVGGGYAYNLFKSTNSGMSWSAFNSGIPSANRVTSMVVDSVTDGNVYAGVALDMSAMNGGVYKSVGGAAWSVVKSGGFTSLGMSPTNPLVVYTTGNGNVVSLTTDGSTWTDKGPIPGMSSPVGLTIAVSPTDPTVSMIGTSSGAFKSMLSGAGWSAVSGIDNTISTTKIAYDPTDSSVAYFATSDGFHPNGLLKSVDGGASASPTGLAPDIVWQLAIDPTTPSHVFAALNTGAVYRSINGGMTWSATPTQNATIQQPHTVVAVAPSNPSIVYSNGFYGGPSGLIHSSDGGVTWSMISSFSSTINDGILSIAVDSTNPNIVYVGGQNGGAYHTTDGGTTLTAINSGLTNMTVRMLVVDPKTPATIYAATGGGVFKTTNSGGAWTASSTGIGGQSVRAIAIDPSSTSNLYAGTASGLYRSTDGGGSWQAATGLPSGGVVSIAVSPSNPKDVYAGMSTGGVLRSPDGGSSWSPIPGLGSHSALWIAVHPTDPTLVYVGTLDGGIFGSKP